MVSFPKTGAAYFGNRHLTHAEADLGRLAESCDYVVHTVSESDFYYHKAALEKVFAATRKRGLEIWADPWGVGGVFGGEALSKFLLDHPSEWQVLNNGKRVPAACPRSEAFRHFLREWTLTVAELGAQVIFWDEPHVFFHWNLELEGVYACACDVCQAAFRRETGQKMPKGFTPEVKAFRRRGLRDLLQDGIDHAARKNMKNALCLYAFEGYEEYDTLWREFSGLPRLNIFGCDPYWSWPPRPRHDPYKHVRAFADRVKQATDPLKRGSQIWIQAMRLAAGTEKEIMAACHAAQDAGVSHVAAWSFDGGALLDTVLAENPAKVWETVEKVYLQWKAQKPLA